MHINRATTAIAKFESVNLVHDIQHNNSMSFQESVVNSTFVTILVVFQEAPYGLRRSRSAVSGLNSSPRLPHFPIVLNEIYQGRRSQRELQQRAKS